MSDHTQPKLTDAQVTDLLGSLSLDGAEPSADFMAKVLADAEAVQQTFYPAPVPAVKPRRFWSVFQALGGMPAAAGFAAAAVVGVGIGLNPPSVMDSLSLGLLGGSDVYLLELVPDLQGALIDG